ncbi:MAG: ROK family protein [Polyangiaceae bacterium]|nr:ROK family protein [Polyangiaceae bacterium]
MAAHELLLGVDLGGTKTEAVVLRWHDGAVLDEVVRQRVPTDRDRGYDAIVTTTALLVESVARRAGRDAKSLPIGVGMPGAVRRGDGCVKNSNTTCLNGRPFREDLQRALGCAVRFDNDANCFALAETTFGAARGHRQGVVFGVIVGTGVGGGVVCQGRVWSGPHGISGEWGHHAVYALPPGQREVCVLRPCYCGNRGCVETYVSGPAVERDYACRAGNVRTMQDIAAVRAVDPHARAAFDLFLDAFSRALANVIDVLDPSAIVLGGGLSNLDALYDEGRAKVAAYVFNDELTTPILRPELGDSAGVIGAALLSHQ